jgi:SAM-dependent methyltransferase
MLRSPNPERVIDVAAKSADTYPVRVPLLRAAAAQAGAFLLIVALTVLVPTAATASGDALTWAWVQGIVAARLGRGLGMETWWLPIHMLFVPGLVWMLGLGLPPFYSLGVFFLLASLYWGVSHTRVPLFLSSRATARAIVDLLPQERSFTFLDLGCGLGGILSYLARARPAGCYYGIEAAPMPFLLSWLRARFGAQAWRVSWGDFRKLDLGSYDVVYAYLSPAAMPGLWNKANREMRAGSLLISNSFAVPGVPPAFMVATGARDNSRLLLWRM